MWKYKKATLWPGQAPYRCLPLSALGIKPVRSCSEGSWGSHPWSSSQAHELLGWDGEPVSPLGCGSWGALVRGCCVIYKSAHLHLQLSPIIFSLALFPLPSNQKDSLIWNPHFANFLFSNDFIWKLNSPFDSKVGPVTTGHGTLATILFLEVETEICFSWVYSMEFSWR